MLKVVFFAILGELGRADEVVKYLLLGIYRVVHEVIYCALAQLDETFECRTDDTHILNSKFLNSKFQV